MVDAQRMEGSYTLSRRRKQKLDTPLSITERVLYSTLIVLGLIGLVSTHQYNLAPAEPLLDAGFFLAAVFTIAWFKPGGRAMFFSAGLYLGFKFVLMYFYNRASLFDFVQAYKAYAYLVPLAFFVGRRNISGPRLSKVTTILLGLFLVKYGYSVVLGYDPRPGLYNENNFELPMLMGFFYLSYPYLRASKLAYFAALVSVVVLSGSRSAAVSLLVLYLALYVNFRSRALIVHVAGIGLVGYGVLSVFSARTGGAGLQGVDRYNFLQVFLRETSPWPFWEYLTGSFPITPLSSTGCGSLAYYSTLFSHEHPNVCYSVILHSYVLRGLFDQGVLGLVLLYWVLWRAFRLAGTSKRDRLAILGIVTASAVSVSAFNNVFVALLFAFTLALDRPSPEAPTAGAPLPPIGRSG